MKENLEKKFDKALVFIIKRKVPLISLAELIGKGSSQTHEKIHKTRYHKFSDDEKLLILKYLDGYKKELDDIFIK